MSKVPPSCALILPCHNEEKAIPSVLSKALQEKQRLISSGRIKNMEVIAVNDGSRDGSAKLLKAHSPKVKVIHFETCRGYGSALKAGISDTNCDWIAFCDLDGTCEPSDLSRLIDTALNDPAEMTGGCRLHKKSSMPFLRRAGNLFYRWMIWKLSGKREADPCSGFRLFKKAALVPEIFDLPDGLNFSPALTALCIKKNIATEWIPVTYNDRVGQSKLKIVKDGWLFFWTIFKYLNLKKGS